VDRFITVQATYQQAFRIFQIAEAVQKRNMRLLIEQNLYFVQYLALSIAETLWELYTEVSPFQYPSDYLVSSKYRLYRNNGATFHYTITFIDALLLWGAAAQTGQCRIIVEVSKSHTIKHTNTHTHITGRTPLKEWSARRRVRYLHNIQQTQDRICTPLAGFERAIPGIKRLAAELGLRPQVQWHRLLHK